jgi:hypothetical protein
MGEAAKDLDETTVNDLNNPEGTSEVESLDSDAGMWEDLAREDELDELAPADEAQGSEEVAEQKVEEVAESEPETEAQPEAEPVAEAEPQPTVQETTPEPEQPVQPQSPQVLTPEQQEWQRQQQELYQQQLLAQRQQQQTTQRQQALDNLARNYVLDPKTAEEFEVNPTEAIPKMAAHLHMAVLEQVLPLVQRMIPPTVQQVQKQTSTVQADEETFFSDYPELREHADKVGQFAAIWRRMNPQADFDTAKKAIGDHMKIALGLHQAPPSADPTPPPPPPPASAKPRTGNSRPQQKSEWDAFVEEVLDDDD